MLNWLNRLAGGDFEAASKQLLKTFATEVVQSVTKNAVEIFGGMGVMRDAPVEKLMRDASIFTHLAGDTVQIIKASRKLG